MIGIILLQMRRCLDILALNVVVVSILHEEAVAFTGELFCAVGVVMAAEYIMSLDVTNPSGTGQFPNYTFLTVYCAFFS
jgi:hypothetical protein